jgi:predicted ABC-type exoprotein transport system permease subunit
VTLFVVFLFVVLSLATLFSTFRWQRRLQGDMAVTGYDETKVRLLIRTNWIRTISYLMLAVLCLAILLRVLEGAG